MKIFQISCLMSIFSISLFSQESWINQIPEAGNAKKMIQTSDNGYLLLINYVSDSTVKYKLYKYNENGTMLWGKTCNFNQVVVEDFTELTNGNIFSVGRWFDSSTYHPYLCMANSNGDTMWTNKCTNMPNMSAYSKVNSIHNNEFWAYYSQNNGSYQYHRYNFNGDILKIDSTFSNGVLINKTLYKISDDSLLFYTSDWNNGTCDLYYSDYNLNILKSKHYNFEIRNIKLTLDKGFIIQDRILYNPTMGVDNNRGLVKLDKNLDSLWSVPCSHYYGYAGSIYSPSNDLIVTSGGGYALCGTLEYDYIYLPYLFKTDSEANWEFIQVYWGINPTVSVNVVETSDSCYVMFQHSQYTNKMWIVKTNKDGSIGIRDVVKKDKIIVQTLITG